MKGDYILHHFTLTSRSALFLVAVDRNRTYVVGL
jgi:hypothetical protein